MRKLTGVEQQYWVDSFPYDLRVGVRAGAAAALLTAFAIYHLALRYWATHLALDRGQHQIAGAFLAVVLAAFAFFGTVAAVLVLRLLLRMYRNPL